MYLVARVESYLGLEEEKLFKSESDANQYYLELLREEGYEGEDDSDSIFGFMSSLEDMNFIFYEIGVE